MTSLKRAGARDDAAEVGALRRPGWTDWALNTAADANPDAVAAFADAADTMRTAQRDALTGRGEGVAAALREVRVRTTEVARSADTILTERGRVSELGALVERLTAVAGSGVATSRLRQGLLRAGDEHLDEPDDEPDVPSPRRAPAKPPARRTARATDAVDDATARAAERRVLIRSVAERERSLRTAEHHAARAEQALAEAVTKRDLAEAAVARAQAELERVAARAHAAAATAHELRDTADREAHALADLRARLDALGA